MRIGQRTVFGHRCQVIGATIGDLCEIGNGAILMPGSRLGDGVILGEGTLIPRHTTVPNRCSPGCVGAGSWVRAGSCVTQRQRFGDLSVIEGMPAHAIGNLEVPLQRPGWALPPDALDVIHVLR